MIHLPRFDIPSIRRRPVSMPKRRRSCRPRAEPLEDRRLLSGGPPDIRLIDVTTRDLVAYDLSFVVAGGDAPPFTFRAYLSADDRLDEGRDELLPGALEIGNPEDRTSGATVHRATLTLASRAPVEDERRFVIVVADPDRQVEPTDGPSRSDNDLPTIPLFAIGGSADRTGVATPDEAGPTASGPFTGAILPGTEDHGRLQGVDLGETWGGDPRFVFGYAEGETQPWQLEEDRRAQRSVVGPLEGLVRLIHRDVERLPTLWGNSRFSINEAYDSLRQHDIPQSLHYEGRALDLDVPGRPSDGEEVARLAGMAWLAGFDFVLHEGSHIHVSERASFATTIDQASLQASVLEAYRQRRIESLPVAIILHGTLDGLDQAIRRRRVLRALGQLLVFSLEVQLWRGNAIADVGFADLLLLNVDLLRRKLSAG